MLFDPPLQEVTIKRRYKRFLVETTLGSKSLTVHCPNTGTMATCFQEGGKGYVSRSSNPKRKLSHTLEITQIETPTKKAGTVDYVGVNTHLCNTLVEEALREERIGPLRGYGDIQREKTYQKSVRFDFYLSGHSHLPNTYLEVKNATLYDSEHNAVMFPDAVSVRGQKHLIHLMDVVSKGFGACLLFVVNRNRGTHFRPADHIDPYYGELLRKAKDHGVMILAYRTLIELPHGIAMNEAVTIQL
ncbi:MAG: DNA/RNA nuclease SfsA [Proteobacteria bacterium]|nr:DNA/RNA nuclease SfsA [Pseudomonadota bacterium]